MRIDIKSYLEDNGLTIYVIAKRISVIYLKTSRKEDNYD
ncbi:hypothetical protein C5L30_000731 [Companilactobacillus farciminis]|uniref:Uncharacterized protein n=1 Tax=Companilactobacillus farciminis TaxID=1612 RepID=A0A4R5NCU3_9LACO|nr:hypothetical protein C5L30_000731 [Companilactobacillus farciminis]